MTLSCICGAVSIAIAKRPEYINECNCSLCAKLGARWGYFHPSEVTVDGETQSFHRTDREAGSSFHFCGRCGATTHFTLTESSIAKHGNVVLGVNMWLAERSDLAGVELRFPDGRNWHGEAAFGYVRAPLIIGNTESPA